MTHKERFVTLGIQPPKGKVIGALPFLFVIDARFFQLPFLLNIDLDESFGNYCSTSQLAAYY